MAAPVWQTSTNLGEFYEDDNFLKTVNATDTGYYNLVALGTINLSNPVEGIGTKIISINGNGITLGTTTAGQLDGLATFSTLTQDTGIVPGKTFEVVDTTGTDVVTTKIIQNGSTAPTFPLTGSILLGTSTTNTTLSLTGIADIETLITTLNSTFNTGIYGIRSSANLLSRTEEFDNAAWNKTGASINADVAVAPDGSTTADQIVEDSGNTRHQVSMPSIAIIGNTTYIRSVFAKDDGSGRNLALETDFYANWVNSGKVVFDISNGTVVDADAGLEGYGIESVGNGWYRCYLISTTIASPSSPVTVDIQLYNSTFIYTGDGSSGAYIWGAQFEVGDTATDYIQNTSTSNILRLTKDNINGGSNLVIDTTLITGGNLQLTDGTYYMGIQQIVDNINNLTVKNTDNVTASVQGSAGNYYLRIADSVTAISIQDLNSSINVTFDIDEFSSVTKDDIIYELNSNISSTNVVSYYTSNGFLELYGPEIYLEATDYSYDILQLLGLDQVGGELLQSPVTEWLEIDETLGVLQGTTPNADITTPVEIRTRAIRDSGLYFNGVDSVVDFGDSHDYTGTSTFSVELWFRYDGTGSSTNPGLITKQVLTPNIDGWGLNIDVSTDTIQFQRWLTSSSNTASGSINVGQRHHAAATYDGTDMRLYIDGVLVDTTASSLSLIDNSGNLELGRIVSSDYFDGIIDEVRIWDDERTITEINDNMYTELTGSEANLVGYWKLNEDTGSTTADSTSSAVTGTLTNAQWVPGLVYTDRTFSLTLQPVNEAGQISWTTGSLGTFDEGEVSESSITVQNFDTIKGNTDFYVLQPARFDFRTKEIDPFNLTRASSATYITNDGRIVTVGNNVARFETNPSTGSFKGLLIEPLRTNLLTYSEEFNNVAWSKSNSSISTNLTEGPDRLITADKLVEDTSTGFHTLVQSPAISGSAGDKAILSCFVKAAERTKLAIQIDTTGWTPAQSGTFDLSSGTSSTGGGATAEMINLGNGWYRCVVIATATGSYTAVDLKFIMSNGSTTNYTGDGVSGVYIWGAQIEIGSYLTSYIKTTNSTKTRQPDKVTLELFNLDYRITVRGTSGETRTDYSITNREYELQALTDDIYVKSVLIDRYHQNYVLPDTNILEITDFGDLSGNFPFHNYSSTRTYSFEALMAYKSSALLGPNDFTFSVDDTNTDTTIDVSLPIRFEEETRTDWEEMIRTLISANESYRYGDVNFGIQISPKINLINGLNNDTLTNFANSIQGEIDGFSVTTGDLKFASGSNYDVIYFEITDNGSTIESYIDDGTTIYPESLTNIRSRLISDIGFDSNEILPDWMLTWEPVIVIGYVQSGLGGDIVAEFNNSLNFQELIGKEINVTSLTFKRNDYKNFEIANTTSSNYMLDFGGSSTDYISFNNITINEIMTLEAWISTTKNTDHSFILYWAEAAGGDGFGTQNETHFGLDSSGNLSLFVRTDSTTHINLTSSTGTYNDGTFYHVAAVIDNENGTVELFADGVSVGTATFTADVIDFSAYTFMYVGGPDGGTTRWFDGYIDQIKIWNVARDQEQIDYYKDKKLFGDEYGLIGYWKIDANTGTTVYDVNTNNNDGTINGTVNWANGTYTITETPYRQSSESYEILIDDGANVTSSDTFDSIPDYVLDYDFTDASTLAESRKWGTANVSLSRASSGTYFDQYGYLRTASTNIGRFDHDPVTLDSLGLLLEEQRENLILQSADFTSSWTIGSVAISSDVTQAPNGSTVGDLVIYSGAAIEPSQTVSITAGDTVIISSFVKKSNVDYVRLYLSGTTDTVSQYFNINTGVIASQTGTTGTDITSVDLANIQDVGNGWYRISVRVATSTITSVTYAIIAAVSDTATSASTDEIYLWGAQFEVGDFVTSYIPTTTTSKIRNADVALVDLISVPAFNDGGSGSVYIDINRKHDIGSTNDRAYSFSDGTVTNRINSYIATGTSDWRFQILGGANSGNIVSSSFVSNTNYRIASGWETNNFNIAINGVLDTADTTVDIPSGLTKLYIGSGYDGATGFFNGHIKRLTYWRSRLTDTQLQTVSTDGP